MGLLGRVANAADAAADEVGLSSASTALPQRIRDTISSMSMKKRF